MNITIPPNGVGVNTVCMTQPELISLLQSKINFWFVTGFVVGAIAVSLVVVYFLHKKGMLKKDDS